MTDDLLQQIESRLQAPRRLFTPKPNDRIVYLTDDVPKLAQGQPFKSKDPAWKGDWVVAKVLPPIQQNGRIMYPYEVNMIRGKTRRDRRATIKALQKPFRHTTKRR